MSRIVLRGLAGASPLAFLALGMCVDLKPGEVPSPGPDAAASDGAVRDGAADAPGADVSADDAPADDPTDGDDAAASDGHSDGSRAGPPVHLQGGFMTFAGQHGFCLNVTGGTLQAGAFLDSSTCAAVPGQDFTLRPGGLIGPTSAPDLCFDLDPTPGLVRLQTCNGGATQQWTVTNGQILARAFSGLCMDVKSAQPTDGQPVDVYYCADGDGQGFWPFGFSVQLATALVDPRTFEPECLAVPDGGADGGGVGSLMADGLCDQTAPTQLFTLTDAHEVTFGGACLGLAGGGLPPAHLELQTCSGAASQRWDFHLSIPTTAAPSIGIVAIQTFDPGDDDGACFDVLGDDPTPGNEVNAEPCYGSDDAQQWDPVVMQP